MPLSDEEELIFDQIAENMYDQELPFPIKLSKLRQLTSTWLPWVTLAFLGMATIVLGVALNSVAVGVAGFTIALAALCRAVLLHLARSRSELRT